MHTATQTFFKKHKILIIIFLIALLARSALFFINFHANDYDLIPTIKGDDGYYELSRGLLLGHGFSWDAEPPFSPNPLRPPVWPLFIAAILYLFKSYWMVLFAQILIGSIIPLLGMHIVNKVIPSMKMSIIVGVLLALEPYSILFSSILYTETFFIFLFFIFLLFFLDYFKNNTYRNIIWAALFLGLATLTKPTVQYLPVAIPFFMLWHFRKNITREVIMQIAVFIGIFMLTIAPWLYRNYKEFGVVGMSAQPAFNLYVYLVPSVLSIENKTSFAEEYKEFVKEDGFDENTITLSNSDYFTSQSVAILKQHPLSLLKSTVNSSVAFFTHDGILTVLMYAGHTPSAYLSKPAAFLLFDSPSEFWEIFKKMITSPLVLVLLGRIIWIIITFAAFFGAARLFMEKKLGILPVLALFLIAYFAATTAINGLGVNARFRMPVNLFIFMFAACGYLHAIRYIKGTKPFVPTSLGRHEKLRFARLLRRSSLVGIKIFTTKKRSPESL